MYRVVYLNKTGLICDVCARNRAINAENQWRQSVINLGGSRPEATSLPLSILFSYHLLDSPEGLSRARSPAAKHFDAIYTVKQPYKIHIDV